MNYITPNWIYDALSKARILKGLFIDTKEFIADSRLIHEEELIRPKEKDLIDFLGSYL